MSIELPDPLVKHNEWLDVRDGVQRDLDVIALAIPGTGGKDVEIRYGNSSVTFTASQTSAATTVTHGLGRAPVAISFGVNDAAVKPAWANKTATTFQIIGRHESAVTGSVLVDWTAIG